MYSLSSWVLLLLPALQGPVPAPAGPESAKIVKTEYDPRELAEIRERAMGRAETPGHKLFISRCALCHDPLGHSAIPRPTLGPWLDAALVTARGETAVRKYILNGSAGMPGFQYQFDAAKIDQIIAYLKTIRPDARPKGVTSAPTIPAAPASPD